MNLNFLNGIFYTSACSDKKETYYYNVATKLAFYACYFPAIIIIPVFPFLSPAYFLLLWAVILIQSLVLSIGTFIWFRKKFPIEYIQIHKTESTKKILKNIFLGAFLTTIISFGYLLTIAKISKDTMPGLNWLLLIFGPAFLSVSVTSGLCIIISNLRMIFCKKF